MKISIRSVVAACLFASIGLWSQYAGVWPDAQTAWWGQQSAVAADSPQDLRFWFVGYRSATVRVTGCSGAVEAIRQAHERGIAISDYGTPRLYYDFDVELSGWSDLNQACIYKELGSLTSGGKAMLVKKMQKKGY